jgi:hypothetical protein
MPSKHQAVIFARALRPPLSDRRRGTLARGIDRCAKPDEKLRRRAKRCPLKDAAEAY